jgi:hypothetical protein
MNPRKTNALFRDEKSPSELSADNQITFTISQLFSKAFYGCHTQEQGKDVRRYKPFYFEDLIPL